jgi:hypothetical protein
MKPAERLRAIADMLRSQGADLSTFSELYRISGYIEGIEDEELRRMQRAADWDAGYLQAQKDFSPYPPDHESSDNPHRKAGP